VTRELEFDGHGVAPSLRLQLRPSADLGEWNGRAHPHPLSGLWGRASRGPKSRKAHRALLAFRFSAGPRERGQSVRHGATPTLSRPTIGRPEGHPSFEGLWGRGRSSPPQKARQIKENLLFSYFEAAPWDRPIGVPYFAKTNTQV
jgi:hypothetical protein